MELQWQSPEPGKKWEQEDQEKAGPEDQDGLHIKKVGALLELTKGLIHKTGIGEGALNLAGGNITGVYERMILEKWCKAEPDYRSGREVGVWRER